eukprot:7796261-Pyramimonas_sp.AAC.1
MSRRAGSSSQARRARARWAAVANHGGQGHTDQRTHRVVGTNPRDPHAAEYIYAAPRNCG